MGILDAFAAAADGLLTLLGVILQTWLLTHAARRVLGVPVGWLRTFLVSLAVLGTFTELVRWALDTGALAIPAQTGASTFAVTGVLAVGALWAFAASAATLVGLEVLWPTGSLPRLRDLLFGWGDRWRRTRRYVQVTGIAARHGLGSQVRGLATTDRPGETARALRATLQDAGVTFVKLGQMLSTRADLLPAPFIAELSHLTNRVPPQPWPVLAQTLADELGGPASEVFTRVAEEPLASASLAQVHVATLPDGRDVVCKVQRAGAAEQVALDLAILRRLARRLEHIAPWARAIGLRALVEGFAASLDEELDYFVELDNMAALRGSMAARDIRMPEVVPELCTARLIVMERLDGTPVVQASGLVAGMDAGVRRASARRILTAVLAQILGDGVFHADLHPGNVLLWPDGQVGLLDFGSVGRLDAGSRRTLGMLLWAIDADDPSLATDNLLDLLDQPEGLDERALEREVGQLVTRYRGGLGHGGSLKVFGELLTLVMRHGFRVPPAVAAALRCLGALEGTLRVIDPDLDLVESARTVAREVVGDVSPASLRAQVDQRLVRLVPLLENLPRRVDRLSQDLAEGRFTMRVRALANPDDRAFLTGLAQQLAQAILAAAAVLGGIWLATGNVGVELVAGVSGFGLLGYLLAFAGFVLALRSVAQIFGPRR